MSRQTTAEFLADCLSHMPDQPEQLQRAIDTVIAALKKIGSGGEWPEEQARAAFRAAMAAAEAAWEAASRAASRAAMAAAEAAWEAAAWAAWTAADGAAWTASYAADWAALSHPDPNAERERQAKVREKLGLNTEGA